MKSLYMLDTNMVSYIAKGYSKAARSPGGSAAWA